MTRPWACALIAAAACGLAAPALCADQSVDEARILAVESRQADAWNAHDAKAYAALFTPGADVVNVLGWWWKGREEIETKLTAAFAFVFADSRLAVERVSIRFLTPDIAVVHVRWTMTGARSPDGGGGVPQRGLQTQTLQRVDGKWLITAFQNTNEVPERPFPTGPAPAGKP